MKKIIKNLINTLKRFRLATTFNILGLSVAFAAFIIILMQVNYERNFDRCYSTSDKVFRVTLPNNGEFSIILSRPFIEDVIHSSPHIKAGTILNPYIGKIYFSVNKEDGKNGFRHQFMTCSPSITDVFDFIVIEGEKDCLKKPESVIIPQSLARTLFGEESAVGKSLHCEEPIWSKDRLDFVIGAVYKDVPENTQIKNVIFTAIDDNYDMSNWYSSNYLCYLLLDDKSSVQTVCENFNTNFDFSKINVEGYNDIKESMALTPLTDIYFLNETQDGNITKSGNEEITKLIVAIAILIIAIAAINFMNFNASLAPLRIRSINTQKVLGCPTSLLRMTLFVETIAITSLSFILGIFYVWIIHQTGELSFIEADLSLSGNLPLVVLCAGISLVIGCLVSIYPVLYMTSFPAVMVLKSNFGLSPSGRKLRTILIGFQFVISIGLIMSASFVWLQNKYIRDFSLGFDKEQIAIVELNSDLYKKHHKEYISRLEKSPEIEGVAFSYQKLGAQDHYATTGAKYNEEMISFFMLPVSWNFFEVLGIPILEGKEPTEDDNREDRNTFFFNKHAQQKYNIEAGTSLESFKTKPNLIIGIVDNVKITSLRSGDDNIGFIMSQSYPLPVSYIRLQAGSDPVAATNHIREVVASIDPSYPFKIEFYDTVFNQLYHKEENLRQMITAFCILAIVISIVGVFGLVIFETNSKRKEIGIRKVHGATISEILVMLNQSYIRITLICFAIATPLVYYGIFKWLERFAYKTPIYWWVFVLSGLLILLLTVIIVTVQSWKAARANPVDSVKNE
ncbi:FtsX-like permease family protein [Dysgonomonas sp. HDW5A]|uniref:ABC transporter permease n=1 Tax=Dysgonomonas sp. HDW5A TaxID=2714926 RepID=UPI001408E39B|nr:ABC transporter permease [Dysgonomonas sp. HDW5A]QIK59873.1 FtsX-like permease family protein [Dysgonomonas sp. HDW5A]